jgi:Copper type II ascorbate-dependent monooxygenase, C-terminal domain
MKLTALSLLIPAAAAAFAGNTGASAVTYTKDAAPILMNRCVGCHRPGEVAPMAFTNYKETRPWAKAIKSAVVARKMPVWLADPAHGSFNNDRRLSEGEIATLAAWVDAGAPEGDPKLMPKMPEFPGGWNIGKPDQIFDMGSDFNVPKEGVIPYKYFTVETNFTEDKWIEAAEIRPSQRAVVHHVIVTVIETQATPGQRGEGGGNLLTGFAPGEQALSYEPGTAKLIRAGSKLRFQMHYTPNGKEATDRTVVALRFAKQAPKWQAITGNAMNVSFKIPANTDDYEVKSSYTAKKDIDIVDFMPHMHVRGKDFKYTIVYPDGRSEVVLSVPKYDFNWQLAYEMTKPIHLTQGARIDCVAHYDNTANNKYNPNPNQDVKWGDQTWEEMMIGWFTYTIPNQAKSAAEATRTGEE